MHYNHENLVLNEFIFWFQSSEDIETRESLALLAASSIDKEGYEGLEKYIQSLSSVESLLTFDRLKQEVAILEAMKKSGISIKQQALDLPVFLVSFLWSTSFDTK